MNRLRHCQKEKILVFLMFAMGLLISLLIPTWQTPDEYAHLNMIGHAMGVEDFAENIQDSVNVERERMEFHYDEKVDLEAHKKALSKDVSYEKSEMLPRTLSLSIIKHLPATIGMVTGIIIGLPSYWVLQIGEVFSLIFYAFICYHALRLMPIKKDVLAYIMFFPMALQQAGSINYDAVLIPMCFLFVAYIFHLKYDKEAVGLKEMSITVCIWLIITFIKVPYVFLIFLAFVVPLEKICVCVGKSRIDKVFIKKVRVPVLCGAMLFSIVCIYLIRDNRWIQIVYGFVVEWKRGLYLLAETAQTWTEFLMTSTVGNFGWLDTPMNFWIVLLIFGGAALLAIINSGTATQRKMRKWDFFVIGGTLATLCIFVTLAMVNHTIKVILFGSEQAPQTYDIRTALYQIPYIGGLQGRYYLPFIYLFFLLIPQKKQISQKKLVIVFGAIEILIYIYVVWLLLQRYWIA